MQSVISGHCLVIGGKRMYLACSCRANKYLNQIQQQPTNYIEKAMSRIIRGLFRWSLEITGVSIVWFNYQPYERQQRLIGIYHFLQNSYRGLTCLYGLYGDFSPLLTLKDKQEEYNSKLADFKVNSARRIEQLCEKNRGVYGRIGQILAGMTHIIPDEYITTLHELDKAEIQVETPYENIKTALTTNLNMQMKQVFDGFQTKAMKVGWLSQTHKAVLLQNYKEVVVKVLLPSTLVQSEHDIWFINQCKSYVLQYLKKHNFNEESLQLYNQAIEKAESATSEQLNLENQVQRYEKIKEIIYDSNSATYIPVYLPKYSGKNVVIRQFVEGIPISDIKRLKEMKLQPEVAFAYVLSEVQHMMKKFNLINGSLSPDNILIRKYIRPFKAATGNAQTEETTQSEAQTTSKRKGIKKNLNLIHPPIQVVFLSQNNYEAVSDETRQSINNFWTQCKKSNLKIMPSIASFYSGTSSFLSTKLQSKELLTSKLYLYEPIIRMYENLIGKIAGRAKAK